LERVPLLTMNARQDTFGQSDGGHAAAVFSRDGRKLAFGVDVDRPHAVDETVGDIQRQGNISEALCAPSSPAIEYCRDAGISLLGFCGGRRAAGDVLAERSILSTALELKHV